MIYKDRRDAGCKLAEKLEKYRDQDPVIIGLPRGGVVVADAVARALDAPLDIIVARKLGAPRNPEFGFGAVGPGGVRVLDDRTVQMLRLTGDDIAKVADAEQAELERRQKVYRGDREPVDLSGKTAVIVDDGLATGVTAQAAIEAARQQDPARVVLAVPVGPADTVGVMRQKVDELICPEVPSNFAGISQFYERFDQTQDEEVIELLGGSSRGS